MTTPIVFPDVELWACTYLRAALASYGYPGTYVSNRRGTQAVAVWVRRDGGGTIDVIRESPRLSVNVFHSSEQGATDLARTVAALLIASPNGDPVLRVTEALGPTPIADSSPRRFMTFEVVVRGVELSS
jgi:hypothetical protein